RRGSRSRGELCPTFCRQGSVLESGRHRLPQGRLLARPGCGQFALGAALDAADRRRAEPARRDHAGRNDGSPRHYADRRTADCPGGRDHHRGTRSRPLKARNFFDKRALDSQHLGRLDRLPPRASRQSMKANSARTGVTRRKSSGGVVDTIKTIVYAILIALVVRTVAYEPFNIPSGSMVPTLLIGDYLFVSKFS